MLDTTLPAPPVPPPGWDDLRRDPLGTSLPEYVGGRMPVAYQRHGDEVWSMLPVGWRTIAEAFLRTHGASAAGCAHRLGRKYTLPQLLTLHAARSAVPNYANPLWSAWAAMETYVGAHPQQPAVTPLRLDKNTNLGIELHAGEGRWWLALTGLAAVTRRTPPGYVPLAFVRYRGNTYAFAPPVWAGVHAAILRDARREQQTINAVAALDELEVLAKYIPLHRLVPMAATPGSTRAALGALPEGP